MKKTSEKPLVKLKKRTCRSCGCTDDDCSGCVKRTGYACYWVADDLCSACFGEPTRHLRAA